MVLQYKNLTQSSWYFQLLVTLYLLGIENKTAHADESSTVSQKLDDNKIELAKCYKQKTEEKIQASTMDSSGSK